MDNLLIKQRQDSVQILIAASTGGSKLAFIEWHTFIWPYLLELN